ncbi:uncharacterized protein [Primulina huaijiensis]|uniref:uncharacterized protein isoform X1 n=2 Tax=Primulina huaijiensis TaxID=1492673 RepID=UPI003CC6DF24
MLSIMFNVHFHFNQRSILNLHSVRREDLLILRCIYFSLIFSGSAYKGYSMPKDAEKYLLSCGLVNALYSIRTSDLTKELFGTLVPCPIQEAVGPLLTSNDSSRKHLKLDPNGVDQNSSACLSCTLEFDGSSKGNPGQAGGGAIIRSDDGSLVSIVLFSVSFTFGVSLTFFHVLDL